MVKKNSQFMQRIQAKSAFLCNVVKCKYKIPEIFIINVYGALLCSCSTATVTFAST